MKRKEFVVEVKIGRRWEFRSDHQNELSAVANLEAIRKIKSVRIKQNGVVIRECKA